VVLGGEGERGGLASSISAFQNKEKAGPVTAPEPRLVSHLDASRV
jgi:hypothetical protein